MNNQHSMICQAVMPGCQCNTCQNDNCAEGNESCCKKRGHTVCPVAGCTGYVAEAKPKKTVEAVKAVEAVAPVADDECDF